MSVEARIRQMVTDSGGRAPVERVVREAMGVKGAPLSLARKLVDSALRELRGLVLEGDDVVERATPRASKLVALALAPVRSATALPAAVAWIALAPPGEPVVIEIAGPGWRKGVAALASDLAGTDVLALSAASARRVLRLGASVAQMDADDEPRVVALGPVARRAGKPLRSADDAAAIVGAPIPESPEEAARLLARLAHTLAELLGTEVAGLRDIAEADAVPAFDFGDRAFGRDDVRALPEAPGVYVFEDAEGDIAYVGKAQSLRKRVASYFSAGADERAARVRDAAQGLSFERTGSELTALLREQQLIRELRPALNAQEVVHARGRAPSGASAGMFAVVQPSAEGGAEVVVLDRGRGAAACDVVPDAETAEVVLALRAGLDALMQRPRSEEGAEEAEIALTWLSERGEQASVVELPEDPAEAADLLARLARDPDLDKGRIIPVR